MMKGVCSVMPIMLVGSDSGNAGVGDIVDDDDFIIEQSLPHSWSRALLEKPPIVQLF
jgi:hypothetical protein